MWPLTIIAAVIALITVSTKLDGAAAIFGEPRSSYAARAPPVMLCSGSRQYCGALKISLSCSREQERYCLCFSALHAIDIVAPEKAMGLPSAVGSCAVRSSLGLLAKLRANRMLQAVFISEPQAVIRRSGDGTAGIL